MNETLLIKDWTRWPEKMVQDDQDEKMGQGVTDVRWFWREKSRTHAKEVSERTVLYESIYQPQNSPCV